MKNLLISALLVGALACPVVYATEDAMPASGQEQQSADMAKDGAKEHGKEMKKAKKAKKHRKHAKKHPKHKRHHKEKDAAMHSQSDEAATHGSETPAEKKIDQETELNNR